MCLFGGDRLPRARLRLHEDAQDGQAPASRSRCPGSAGATTSSRRSPRRTRRSVWPPAAGGPSTSRTRPTSGARRSTTCRSRWSARCWAASGSSPTSPSRSSATPGTPWSPCSTGGTHNTEPGPFAEFVASEAVEAFATKNQRIYRLRGETAVDRVGRDEALAEELDVGVGGARPAGLPRPAARAAASGTPASTEGGGEASPPAWPHCSRRRGAGYRCESRTTAGPPFCEYAACSRAPRPGGRAAPRRPAEAVPQPVVTRVDQHPLVTTRGPGPAPWPPPTSSYRLVMGPANPSRPVPSWRKGKRASRPRLTGLSAPLLVLGGCRRSHAAVDQRHRLGPGRGVASELPRTAEVMVRRRPS